MFNKIFYCISERNRLLTAFILLIIIIGGAAELIGVSLFNPFLEILMNPESVETNKWLNLVYSMFPFGNTTNFLAFIAAVIIFVYIFKNAFLVWQKSYIYKYSYNLQKEVSERLLSAFMRMPYTFFLNVNIAELQRTLLTDTDYFSKAVIHTLELLSEVFVCATLCVYLFTVSHSISIIVVLILLIFMTIFIKVSKMITKRISKKAQICSTIIQKDINQSFGGIKEIKVLGREQTFIDDYSTILEEGTRLQRIMRLLGIVPKYVIEAGSMSGMLFAIILKLYFGKSDFQSFIPQLGVFAVAAFRLMPSVGRINEHYNAIIAAGPSVDVIYRYVREVEEQDSGEDISVEQDQNWQLQDGLHIRHVSYAYPNTAVNVIDDVTFDIPKGKTVAFIGSSGAGKSTMIDLILGVLTPQRGVICADDLNIDKNLRTWQQEVGYIPQTIYLSDDTIRNNIAFGIPEREINEDAVRLAAERAQLTDFVESLPDGFDTVVGDRGVRLSGGQRQRIGIARALYHDPEVLFLDEATSALDNETETAVMEAIDGLHGQKTMIIIAHRLTTIRNADQIYEVSDGKVIPRDKDEVLS